MVNFLDVDFNTINNELYSTLSVIDPPTNRQISYRKYNKKNKDRISKRDRRDRGMRDIGNRWSSVFISMFIISKLLKRM
jgi:hypothetical protein